MATPRFHRFDRALLIAEHKGRRTITPVTIVGAMHSPIRSYEVRSDAGGTIWAPETDLRPDTVLDRLALETNR